MSLFKTKDYSKPKRVKTVYGGGKRRSEESTIKSISNLFKLKKKKMKELRVRVGNFWNYNYIEYESRSDRKKTLSVK